MATVINESIKMDAKPVETNLKVATSRKEVNKGAWTAEEDRKLAEIIAAYGPKRWKSIAAKAGLNRCGKSCRLRWMNYLRPNIKRGNISDQEEDLILRLHKLLGNRWSLIAGRLPGRTDNEIKNYWNSHLSKRIKQKGKQVSEANSTREATKDENTRLVEKINVQAVQREENTNTSNSGVDEEPNNTDGFDVDEFFDFSNENPQNLEWINRFLEPTADEGFK